MSRIRTLKPEWSTDETLQQLGDAARVLSAALITMADDYGNGRAGVGHVAGYVWAAELEVDAPGTLAKVQESLARLSRAGFVKLYEVRGQRYYHLNGWEDHQRVDKRGKPRCPKPEEAEITHEQQDSGETRETFAKDSGDSRETLAPDLDLDLDLDRRAQAGAGAREAYDMPKNAVSPEDVQAAYAAEWERRNPKLKPPKRSSVWDTLWQELANDLDGPEQLAQLMDAFWADDWCGETGFKPGALASERARLLANGPRQRDQSGTHPTHAGDENLTPEQRKARARENNRRIREGLG